MNSMSECINFLNRKRYTEQFKVEDKKLISLSDGKQHEVDEVTAMNFYRFEGISNPEDM
jgi:hypothetical protein